MAEEKQTSYLGYHKVYSNGFMACLALFQHSYDWTVMRTLPYQFIYTINYEPFVIKKLTQDHCCDSKKCHTINGAVVNCLKLMLRKNDKVVKLSRSH